MRKTFLNFTIAVDIRFVNNIHNGHKATGGLYYIPQHQAAALVLDLREKLLEFAELALFAVEGLNHRQVSNAE